MEVFYPSFFRHVDFSAKGNSRGWSMIYHRWRVMHHGTAPFPIHAPISKGRTALFRHFGRMLHLAPRCCTLWISILRRAITLGPFVVTRAITCQNEGICEFYSYDGFQPSLVSFIPKKILSEPQSGQGSFLPFVFSSRGFFL